MKTKNINDRSPNFRDKDGKLFLVCCFNCDSEKGKENYALNVALGQCTWCGWSEKENKNEKRIRNT